MRPEYAGPTSKVPLRPPSWSRLVGEQLAVFEYGLLFTTAPMLSLGHRGDGRPVLVVPGFTGSDYSTWPLRAFLRNKGYFVHGWDLGANVGPRRRIVDGIDSRLTAIARRHGTTVSLIGWSLGGIYARELARSRPEAVRQVIALASPFRFRSGDRSFASPLYDVLAPRTEVFAGRLIPEESRPPLPVPATSIYSRTDGVVRWHACVDTAGANCENIEVFGTHSGMGVNIAALIAISDRLAQPEGQWAPFKPPAALRYLFPKPASWRPADGSVR
jgi:pimeloyl-ACP methyl ester carboxylesterase